MLFRYIKEILSHLIPKWFNLNYHSMNKLCFWSFNNILNVLFLHLTEFFGEKPRLEWWRSESFTFCAGNILRGVCIVKWTTNWRHSSGPWILFIPDFWPDFPCTIDCISIESNFTHKLSSDDNAMIAIWASAQMASLCTN